jgi:hypothetical protein
MGSSKGRIKRKQESSALDFGKDLLLELTMCWACVPNNDKYIFQYSSMSRQLVSSPQRSSLFLTRSESTLESPQEYILQDLLLDSTCATHWTSCLK